MTAANTYTKPFPRIDDSNRPHWEGAQQGELRIQRCKSCGTHQYPPARWCSECLSDDIDWVAASGKGTVWSWCVFHRAYFKGFEQDLPYPVVLVELEEGPRIYSNLVGLSKDEIRIGMRVQAVFEPVTREVTLVKFKEDK